MKKTLESKTDRELLEELYVKVHHNNKMIKGVYSRMRFQNFLGTVKWVIYIGIIVGLYAYLQPYYESLIETYRNLQEGSKAVIEVRDKIPSFPFFQ